MNYFQPDFYLGMTATPERTDGQNIYELLTIILPMRSVYKRHLIMICFVHLYTTVFQTLRLMAN